MATYFVASGGSNTSPYDTWAKAATSLQTALTAASSGTDVVVIQYNAVPTADAQITVDTGYTTANHVSIISASNDGGSAYTPTEMGTANWIGNSTTSYRVGIDAGADDKVYIYGVTWRIAASTGKELRIAGSAGADIHSENCYFWQNSAALFQSMVVGTASGEVFCSFKDCTFRFGSTSQTINIYAQGAEFIDCEISTAGSAPAVLIVTRAGAAYVLFEGCDLSHVTNTLVANTGVSAPVQLSQCKLASGVTILAPQTVNPTRASGRAVITDCSSGDTHGIFGFYTALGSCVTDTGIYYTTTQASLTDSSNTDVPVSWKIVTTANCSYFTPFKGPWIDWYNTATSAVTPYVEILRDGSATAYQDDEVWLELVAKVTSGSTLSSAYVDRLALATKLTGSPANQAAGAGTGSWTGENATAWSGKIDSGASLTPAEKGAMRARIVVGEPSITLYVDPVIRT